MEPQPRVPVGVATSRRACRRRRSPVFVPSRHPHPRRRRCLRSPSAVRAGPERAAGAQAPGRAGAARPSSGRDAPVRPRPGRARRPSEKGRAASRTVIGSHGGVPNCRETAAPTPTDDRAAIVETVDPAVRTGGGPRIARRTFGLFARRGRPRPRRARGGRSHRRRRATGGRARTDPQDRRVRRAGGGRPVLQSPDRAHCKEDGASPATLASAEDGPRACPTGTGGVRPAPTRGGGGANAADRMTTRLGDGPGARARPWRRSSSPPPRG